jgi:hypothetical protein
MATREHGQSSAKEKQSRCVIEEALAFQNSVDVSRNGHRPEYGCGRCGIGRRHNGSKRDGSSDWQADQLPPDPSHQGSRGYNCEHRKDNQLPLHAPRRANREIKSSIEDDRRHEESQRRIRLESDGRRSGNKGNSHSGSRQHGRIGKRKPSRNLQQYDCREQKH